MNNKKTPHQLVKIQYLSNGIIGMLIGSFHLISTPPCTRDFPRGVKIQISEGVVNRISEGQKRKSGKFPRVDGSREFLRVKKRKRWKIRRFTRISEGQEEKKMENSEG